MSPSQQTNPVKNSSTFIETVQDKLKDIKNFSNWSAKEQMVAVSAVGVMVGALLPVMAVALPVAATGAVVALTLFFAYKGVEYAFKGLKWSAGKAVEGAKDLYGKAKESIDSLKKSFKERSRIVSYNHAKESAAMKRMAEFSQEDNAKADEIKCELKAIFNKERDDTDLTKKNVLSKIKLIIESKISELSNGTHQSAANELVSKLKTQKNSIESLDPQELKRVVNDNGGLPSNRCLITEIFSKHHDEIKGIIESHNFKTVESSRFYFGNSPTGNTDNDATIAERNRGRRNQIAIGKLLEEGRKQKKSSTSAPEIPRSADSAVGSSSSSTPDEYRTPNASGGSTPIGNLSSQGFNHIEFVEKLTAVESSQNTLVKGEDSTSSDSGRDSGSSTPERKTQADLKHTGRLGTLVHDLALTSAKDERTISKGV